MNTNPTQAELEILNILWEDGPSTVRSINDKLNKKKKTGYTTTLKLMQIMLDKNLLSRIDGKRGHIYYPESGREEIQGKLLRKFLKSTFSGSSSTLIIQALGNHKPSKKELHKIKELIEKLESDENGTDR